MDSEQFTQHFVATNNIKLHLDLDRILILILHAPSWQWQPFEAGVAVLDQRLAGAVFTLVAPFKGFAKGGHMRSKAWLPVLYYSVLPPGIFLPA
jgi:hypothetical protein